MMTAVQLAAIKRLAERYGAGLENVGLVYDIDGVGICGLPRGWVLATVHRDGDPVVTAGVGPDGRVAT